MADRVSIGPFWGAEPNGSMTRPPDERERQLSQFPTPDLTGGYRPRPVVPTMCDKQVIAAYRNSRQTRLTICTSLLQREPHDSGDHVRPAMHSHSRFPLQLTGAYIRLPSRASPVPDQNQQDIGPIPNWTASSRWRCRQTVYSPSYWSPFAPLALDRRAHIEPVPTD
jgi:hypothetical protein